MWKPYIKTKNMRFWEIQCTFDFLSVRWMMWKAYKLIGITILNVEFGFKKNTMFTPQYTNTPKGGQNEAVY